jgi:hypothetical protein
MGGQEATTLLRHQCRTVRDRRGQRPVHRVQHPIGGGALAWSTPLPSVRRGMPGHRVQLRAVSTVLQRRARLWGSGFTGQGRAAQVLTRASFLGTRLTQLCVDRVWGWRGRASASSSIPRGATSPSVAVHA